MFWFKLLLKCRTCNKIAHFLDTNTMKVVVTIVLNIWITKVYSALQFKFVRSGCQLLEMIVSYLAN